MLHSHINVSLSIFLRGKTDPHREEGHVKAEAETGVMQPKSAKDGQEPPAARKEFFLEYSESMALPILRFQISSLQSCENKFLLF